MTKEELKKEAEEYANNNNTTISCDCNYYESKDDLKDAYLAGAEFGYNKANEWHYVKDGDLPKDKKDTLMSEHLILLTKMKGAEYLNITLGQYNFSTQEFSYQHIIGLIDVIAWKEIVIPKEIEK